MAEDTQRPVLVVEDNEVNQAVAIAILARLGYHADLADDGQQGVELVVRGRYGLVLMDCQLPVLDGYQATAEIRRREGTARRTPIVAMTAAVLEDRQRCLAAGMDDHIAKPVLLAELQVVLSQWLEGGVTTAQAGGPAAATEPTWEVLDPNRLTELGMLDATENSTVLIDSLVERLLARIPVDLADLRTALDQGDATGVTRITHRLKGAAATVGSSGMVGLCEHLEVLARTGAILPADDLVSRLEQEFNRVIRALEAVIPGRRSPGPPGR
jgi:CheY-like chemotaxis protein/HPt (histidine-containing phosphotransfer) domain-containing protein